MRSLLTLPLTLPYRIARAGLSLAAGLVGQALGQRGDATADAAAAAYARAAPSAPAPSRPEPSAPPPPAPAPAPVTPLRPERPAPPPVEPPPAARRPHVTVDEPPPFGPAPPTPPEAVPPEPTHGQAAREREARREAEATPDSPGAQIRVDEPWAGYRKQPAAEIVARLNGADEATKAVVRLFESRHRKRKTVLAATGE
jgi:hypothetical protein